MSDSLYVNTESIDGACGITHVNYYTTDAYDADTSLEGLNISAWGAGFAIASFIESKRYPEDDWQSRKVYEELKKKYKVVYESPKRINKNTDNLFWFCVYDTQEKGHV